VEPVLVGVLVVLEENLNLVVHLVPNVLAEKAGYFSVRRGLSYALWVSGGRHTNNANDPK
jgi:hypothetical protein